jgi:hypothetical protein
MHIVFVSGTLVVDRRPHLLPITRPTRYRTMVPERRPITNLCEAGGMGNRRRSDEILCTFTRISTFMIEETVTYKRDKSRRIICSANPGPSSSDVSSSARLVSVNMTTSTQWKCKKNKYYKSRMRQINNQIYLIQGPIPCIEQRARVKRKI